MGTDAGLLMEEGNLSPCTSCRGLQSQCPPFGTFEMLKEIHPQESSRPVVFLRRLERFVLDLVMRVCASGAFTSDNSQPNTSFVFAKRAQCVFVCDKGKTVFIATV